MLALHGGPPVARPEDWPRWPVLTSDTMSAVETTLRSGRWSLSGLYTGGKPREQEFAERFAAYCGVPHCVPTSSGSAALAIALEALDVGAGDEVIVPGLTWVACPTAVIDVNAIPILVDVDPHSLCLDAATVAAALTPRTRAVLAVHLYCSMVDMDTLTGLLAPRGIPILEDCAQSHGSVFRGRRAGALGTIGAFSMHQGKVLTSGEGGAAVTADAHLHRRMEQLRSDGRRYLDQVPPKGHMQLEETGELLGSNRSLSEVAAALALDGLSRLDAENRHREESARHLDARLRELGLFPVVRPAGVERQTYYHYAVRFAPEDFAGRTAAALGRALSAELGLWVHPPYVPLPRHPLYYPQSKRRYQLSAEHWARLDPARFHLPRAAEAYERHLVLHHAALLGDQRQLDLIVEAIDKVRRAADRVPV